MHICRWLLILFVCMGVPAFAAPSPCDPLAVAAVEYSDTAFKGMDRQSFSPKDKSELKGFLATAPMIASNLDPSVFMTLFTTDSGDSKKIIVSVEGNRRTVRSVDRAKPQFVSDFLRQTNPLPDLPDFSEETLLARVKDLANLGHISATHEVEQTLRSSRTAFDALKAKIASPIGDRIIRSSTDMSAPGSIWALIGAKDQVAVVYMSLSSRGDQLTITKVAPAQAAQVRRVLGEVNNAAEEDEASALVIEPKLLSHIHSIDLTAKDVNRLFKRAKAPALLHSNRTPAKWFISTLSQHPESFFYVEYMEDEDGHRVVSQVRLAENSEVEAFAKARDFEDINRLRKRPRYRFEFGDQSLLALAKFRLSASDVIKSFYRMNTEPEHVGNEVYEFEAEFSHGRSAVIQYKVMKELNEVLIKSIGVTEPEAAPLRPRPPSVTRRFTSASDRAPEVPSVSLSIPEGNRPVEDENGRIILSIAPEAHREVVRWQISDRQLIEVLDREAQFEEVSPGTFAVLLRDEAYTLRLHFQESEGSALLNLTKVDSLSPLPSPTGLHRPFPASHHSLQNEILEEQPFELSSLARRQLKVRGLSAPEIAEVLWSRPSVQTVYPAGENPQFPFGLFEVSSRLRSEEDVRISFTLSTAKIVVTDIALLTNGEDIRKALVPVFALTLGVENYFWERSVRPTGVRNRVAQLFANRTSPILKLPEKGYGMYDIFWFLSETDSGEKEKVVYSLSPLTQKTVILYVGPPRRNDVSNYTREIGAHNFYFDMEDGRVLIVPGDLRRKLDHPDEIQIHEIEEALQDKAAIEIPIFIDKYKIIAQTDSGRVLSIFCRKTSDHAIRVLSVKRL